MKGGGEPVFEHDFPGGVDAVAEIEFGPCGSKRLKLGRAARLHDLLDEGLSFGPCTRYRYVSSIVYRNEI